MIPNFKSFLGRTNEELEEEAMVSSSGASLHQSIVIQPYHLLSFHLISRLPDMVQCYFRFCTTQNKHITSSLQQKTMKKDATQHHYFHHQYIKSISLAVLALFTFWWWYHSFWLGGFLADANNIQHQRDSFSYHQRLSQKTDALKTRCKNSESEISAKKKVTFLSKAQSTSCVVIYRKYQKREKLMYLDER